MTSGALTRRYAERHHGCRVEEFIWRGHQLVVLENELLRVGVVATKGADVVELRYKPLDLDFMWHAPHPLLPPGEAVPTTPSPTGTFFDQYHGGWQESLPAGNGVPALGKAQLGLHGEVSSQPWDVRLVQDDAERVAVEFSVRGRRTPFWLRRTMIVERDRPFVTLDETLVNEGEEPVPFMWGHHPAFGGPLLSEGAVLELPAAPVTVRPMRNPRLAAGTYDAWPHLRDRGGREIDASVLPSKSTRTADTLFLDLSGRPTGFAALRHPEREVGAALEWDARVFPYVWSWQVFGGAWGYPFYGRAHLVAIEPFTAPIGSLEDAIQSGHARPLDPGAQLSTSLRAGAVLGRAPFTGFEAS
ncbi:MAG TPA: aldose 1-epimerase [Chloroflexota bacterium]|nr:aldose 1-epimerase [Chloroflexota bacterium]